MTPAEPGWDAQAAEFSAAGLLHDAEPSTASDYDAEPSREDYDASPLARALTNIDATSASSASRRDGAPMGGVCWSQPVSLSLASFAWASSRFTC